MSRGSRITLILLILLISSGYILPHWFIIKESASARSQFSIRRCIVNATIHTGQGKGDYFCKSEFRINREEKTVDIHLACEDVVSDLRFKESKLISQNLKQPSTRFAKALAYLIEYEEMIFPFPIASDKLKRRICQIIPDCNNVDYKRLSGNINYRFFSQENGNYYMVDKDRFLPSALYIKDKGLEIALKKYYSFSTNIRFPSVVEINIDNIGISIEIEDLEIE